MVSIALVMAVIVTNIYAKKNSPERCPAWAVRLASRFFPAHYLPERQMSSVSLASTVCGDKEMNTGASAMSLDRSSRARKTYDADPSNSYRTLAQTGNRRGYLPRAACAGNTTPEWDEHGGRAGAAERRAKRMQRSAASSSYESYSAGRQSSEESTEPSQEKFDKARAKAEWRLVALFADRFFLWIFAGLSLTVHVSLFVQMIPWDRD